MKKLVLFLSFALIPFTVHAADSTPAAPAYKPEIKTIEYGQFRVEYQTIGKAKKFAEAKAACAAIDQAKPWALPTIEQLIGSLVLGQAPFTAIGAPNGSKAFLIWFEEAKLGPQPAPEDYLALVAEGGAGIKVISLNSVVEAYNLPAEKLAELPKELLPLFEANKKTVGEGAAIICYRALAPKENK